MTKSLFNEFNPVSAKAWKQKIQLDLKGADYNSTLVWNSPEGIDVKPFYHAEGFETISQDIKTPTSWSICETIYVKAEKSANEKALTLLSKGAESLKFIITNESISLDALLNNIDPQSIPIYISLDFLNSDYIKKEIAKINIANVIFNTDIIGNLIKTGNWYNNLKSDHKHFEEIVKETKSLSVNLSTYQNAGASIVQQLAYSLAHTNEYLNHFDNHNIDLQKLSVNYNVSIGTNYFFEIAKLRALRLLFTSISDCYDIDLSCNIFAFPSERNKTLYDYNTNMLRTTTECMSAVLGGANTINNLAYDALYHKDNQFGSRISRNQLLVLKHESYFDQVSNVSEGAYYIESLTNQLAEKALEIFKNIEAKGGFVSQLFDGTIQRKISESAIKEQTAFNNQEEVLLGTNKHPNPNDKMQHELELYPFVKTNVRKTLIEPIIEKRLSETIEKERLENEKNL